MALPIKTSSDDVRQVIRYLRTKPTGATLDEARATVDKRLLDGRKQAAYVAWGFLTRDAGRLKLTDRGWAIARQPDREQEMFRQVLDSVRPYRSALEWINHSTMESVTASDISAHWHEHHKEVVGDANANTLRENAIAFFNLAETAGFGTLTAGRGGKETRLEVNLRELSTHIEAGPSVPPWRSDLDELADSAEEEESGSEPDEAAEKPDPDPTLPAGQPEKLRVFIAHGSNMAIVEQIEVTLGIADIEYEVAEEEETTAIPVPDKVLDAMRRCGAGIIAVAVDESRRDDEGNYTVNENVLIEIGAAFVLYERRVVLVWDKRLRVPSNLQGLYRCEFEGNELGWDAGIKLMKAIQNFKKSP
jgi:predicted nucleotide-binding protein